MFERVHHLGIAVLDIDAAIAQYQSIGGRLIGRETTPDGTVELAMLALGDGSMIEPISPTGARRTARSPATSAIGARVCTTSPTLSTTSSLRSPTTKAQGHGLIDEMPRPGFGGHLIAFVKPATTMGVLWELVQEDH